MERRLAAILAADVVGYTRLMGKDEAGTLQRMNSLRQNLIEPLLAEHRGRLVKLLGDGLLVEFASALDAIFCALAWQNAVAELEEGRDADSRIRFRIGINLGDVIAEEGDIFGDGVNIAARLEGIARPSSICLSEDAYRQVRGKVDAVFEDMGEQILKNVADPIRTYQIAFGEPENPAAPQAEDKPGLIVLPFTNLSGDPEQAFFADGLTEDIIAALSAWRYFPVASRGTSFHFKGKAADARRIATELGVRYVLEGSVRRSGNRSRISVQLSDAVADAQVWNDHFDRDVEDLFALQDEIAQRIAAVVSPELEKAEGRRIRTASPANFGAWEMVQRGVALLQEFTPEGNAAARDMFEQAIRLDPAYTKAYTGLAYSYHRDIFWDFAGNRDEWIRRFLEAATQAVRLDDTDSSAQLVLGYANIWARRFDLAEAELRRAVELHPGNAFAHVALGEAIDLSGRPIEAHLHIHKGIDLNRRDPRVHTFVGALARVHLNARDYEQAVGAARDALETRPDYPHANAYLLSALGHLGLKDEARIAWERCPTVLPGFATAYRDPADVAHYLDGLEKAGIA